MAANGLWRRLLRYDLASLMFVMLCACGYLGSYRYGERAGAKKAYDESFFYKQHSLVDLLVEIPAKDEREKRTAEFAEHIKASLAPASWNASGPQQGEMVVLPQFGSLLVGQHGAVHDQIAVAIDRLRSDANRQHVDEAVKELESLCAQKCGPTILASFTSQDTLRFEALQQRYECVVQGLEKAWGGPRFAGECTEVGFPVWSAAYKIAVWPANGGEAYIALQDRPNLGRVVLAGWRAGD